jgi:hypothetical protein
LVRQEEKWEFGEKNPTDRSKRNIKQVILVDRKGAPLYAKIAAANVHDSKLFLPILEHFHLAKKIRIIAADSAFDVKKLYKECKKKTLLLLPVPIHEDEKICINLMFPIVG